MKEFLTPNSIANEIRMLRTRSDKQDLAFLIVEGDTDVRLCKNLVNTSKCSIKYAVGKDRVIEVIQILEKDNFSGMLAIVDADFWILEKTTPPSANILLTDTHDLETMLFQSPALEKVLTEFGSESKIENFTSASGKDVRSLLIESSLPIGYLRWVSQQKKLELKFQGLAYNKFIKATLVIDINQLITAVKNNSQQPGLNNKDMQQKIEKLMDQQPKYDSWQVCCGHDMTEILSIALAKLLGTNNTGDIKAEKLEVSLRLAYERDYFAKTQLYQAVLAWEAANPPFKVI